MKARLYSNENFPLPVVEALRRMGHDVLTTHNVGKSNEGVPDDEVLAYAIAEDRAVLKHNRKDYIRLHRLNPAHAGIIVCTSNPDFPALAIKIDATLSTMDSLRDVLLRVNRGD
ncbi:DUF5615 family PIN-like protein [Prosthecobacter sp.]|uniref:DUF5615 family PIN-like protein n=1 Tax=Prosthecobacter sp. TaxID=1965333 RepID=UPI003783916A